MFLYFEMYKEWNLSIIVSRVLSSNLMTIWSCKVHKNNFLLLFI